MILTKACVHTTEATGRLASPCVCVCVCVCAYVKTCVCPLENLNNNSRTTSICVTHTHSRLLTYWKFNVIGVHHSNVDSGQPWPKYSCMAIFII